MKGILCLSRSWINEMQKFTETDDLQATSHVPDPILIRCLWHRGLPLARQYHNVRIGMTPLLYVYIKAQAVQCSLTFLAIYEKMSNFTWFSMLCLFRNLWPNSKISVGGRVKKFLTEDMGLKIFKKYRIFLIEFSWQNFLDWKLTAEYILSGKLCTVFIIYQINNLQNLQRLLTVWLDWIQRQGSWLLW